MRHSFQFSFILLSAVTLCFQGCDTFKSIFKSSEENNSEEPSRKVITLPTDRESLHSNHNTMEFSAKELEEGIVTGDWTIEEVNGEAINSDTPAYLKFIPKEKRVYGNNGCNTLNADYSYNKEEKLLSFSKILTTLRLCSSNGEIDEMINLALNSTTNYSWAHENDEYYLYFYDASGNKIMTLVHQTFEFLNGSWYVEKIENDEINNPDMKLVIDIDDLKIHGNTGCNILNGEVDIDMETANNITFHSIMTTKMACDNPENETRLIVALEDVAHAKPVDNNTVILLNLLRQPVLTLKRI